MLDRSLRLEDRCVSVHRRISIQIKKGIHMDTQSPRSKRIINVDEVEKVPSKPISRRTLFKIGGISGMGILATTIVGIGAQAWVPKRVGATRSISFPDIQFDIGNFIAPVQTIAGVPVQFGPIFT